MGPMNLADALLARVRRKARLNTGESLHVSELDGLAYVTVECDDGEALIGGMAWIVDPSNGEIHAVSGSVPPEVSLAGFIRREVEPPQPYERRGRR